MLEWLIIGGGIHGTYLSRLLLGEAGISPDDLRLLDPHDLPLAVWLRQTENCGMAYLRSPATHNIDRHILSVHRFAKSDKGRPYADFIPPYYRPSLPLFRKHCEYVIREKGLKSIRLRGQAHDLHPCPGALTVETETGRLTARHLIFCPGQSAPCWPPWATALRDEGTPVFHVFDPTFRRERLPDLPETWVVGGGITAVQLALALAREKEGHVTLLSRHAVRENNLDFDPCWIGPKCLRGFRQTDYPCRREIVDGARNRGTVPGETVAAFNQTLAAGELEFRQGAVCEAVPESGRIRVRTDQGTRYADQIILATGFASHRPGGPFADRLVRALDLKTAACGFPVLDDYFRWHPRLFVSGALAELQGGPCARNIVGARHAGQRILEYIRSQRR